MRPAYRAHHGARQFAVVAIAACPAPPACAQRAGKCSCGILTSSTPDV